MSRCCFSCGADRPRFCSSCGSGFDDTVSLPPPAKRYRRNAELEADDVMIDPTSLMHLPPDMLALSLEYLSFRDLVNCTAVCRSFLHNVAPRVEHISILKANEMHVSLARRCKGVKTVFVYSLILFEDADAERCRLCTDTVGVVVPFLSNFPRLERANLGGYHPGEAYFVDYEASNFTAEGHKEIMRGLARAVCGGYRSGLIPPDAEICGVSQGNHHHDDDHGYPGEPRDDCAICSDISKTFPLINVIQFRSRHNNCASGLDYVCFPYENLVKIIANRPGGVASLRHPVYLLNWVLKHSVYDKFFYRSRIDGETVTEYHYGYHPEDWDKLEAILKLGFKPKGITRQHVLDFYDEAESDYRGIRNTWSTRRYITKAKFNFLVRHGIPLLPSDFNGILHSEPDDTPKEYGEIGGTGTGKCSLS